MSNEDIPQFSEEQKRYFQEQLAAQSGKTLSLNHELLTHDQKAELAHTSGDLTEVLNDHKVRQAYTAKFGVAEFGRQHLIHTRTVREKEKAAERQRLLEAQKARTTRGRIGR